MATFPIDAEAPLAGVRVLDAARVLAGPFCAQLLADLGADVIKLERPGQGDDTRGWGPPFVGELSAYFLSCNRNKRSITLDIARAEGQEVLHALLGQCDVLIENFRSDSAAKLGLTPEVLLARHPQLVICSISGYGRTGPMKDTPGYDFAIQALSGLMNITGSADGPPYKVGVALADILTGLYGATAILAALRARERSGHGYAIDLALLDCAVAAQVNVAQAYLASGRVPERQGNAHLQIVPYQLFATADGWLVVNVGNDTQWQAFCQALEAPALGADPRYTTNRQRVEQRTEVIPQLETILATRSTADWEARFQQANIPHAVVSDYARVFASEHALARGLKVTVTDPAGHPVDLIGNPIHMTGSTLPAPRLPPHLGVDTDAVLRDLAGLDDTMLSSLRDQGII